MVVTYTENPMTNFYLQKNLRDIKEIEKNCEFRTDTVYRDCCYKITNNSTVKHDIKIPKKQAKTKPIKPCFDNQFCWTKVYKSPTTRKNVECKKKHRNIVIDCNLAISEKKACQNLEECENHNLPNSYTNLPRPEIITQIGTSVTSINNSKHVKISEWYKNAMPKLLCPCCCGGEDQMEPYQRATDAYDSIDLKSVSNPYLHLADLDASLMSIIQLHGRLKSRRTRKFYLNMVKAVFHNTYKNAISFLYSH